MRQMGLTAATQRVVTTDPVGSKPATGHGLKNGDQSLRIVIELLGRFLDSLILIGSLDRPN